MEEFLAKHPEHATDDENALMVARIEDERAEREALEQQRQELLKRKQKLIADNKKRREDLANLDNDLEKFIDVRSQPELVLPQRLVTMLMFRYLRRRNQSRRLSKRLSEPTATALAVHSNPAKGWNATSNPDEPVLRVAQHSPAIAVRLASTQEGQPHGKVLSLVTGHTVCYPSHGAMDPRTRAQSW